MNTLIQNETAGIPPHLVINFYADTGHGWGKVENSLLKQLGIDKDISRYSFTKGDFAYLEEDCDLPKFCQKITSLGITFSFIENVDEYHESSIRHYKSYGSN